MDACECGGGRVCGVHGDLDPSHRDRDAGPDPEELEPEGSGGGAGQVLLADSDVSRSPIPMEWTPPPDGITVCQDGIEHFLTI